MFSIFSSLHTFSFTAFHELFSFIVYSERVRATHIPLNEEEDDLFIWEREEKKRHIYVFIVLLESKMIISLRTGRQEKSFHIEYLWDDIYMTWC